MRLYAHLVGTVIDNVIVLDPKNCGTFDLSGYVDITDTQPRPGIGWQRNGSDWLAPAAINTLNSDAAINMPPVPSPPDVPNGEKYDTVTQEEEDSSNGLTSDYRSATTEGNGL